MTSGWTAKGTPAIATEEGCLERPSALDIPGTVFNKPKVVRSGGIPAIEAVPEFAERLIM